MHGGKELCCWQIAWRYFYIYALRKQEQLLYVIVPFDICYHKTHHNKTV